MRFKTWAVVVLLSFLGFGSGVALPQETSVKSDSDPEQDNECRTSTTLKWSAKSERSVFGYLIYRSESPEGPFVRLNEKIERTRGVEEASTAEYSFEDREVVKGKTYYYYLDYVTNTGLKHRFSGVVTKVVQAPSCGEADHRRE